MNKDRTKKMVQKKKAIGKESKMNVKAKEKSKGVVEKFDYLANARKLFKSHGEFCASQPWEVIVTTITFLVCLLTVVGKQSPYGEGHSDKSANPTCSSGGGGGGGSVSSKTAKSEPNNLGGYDDINPEISSFFFLFFLNF